MDRATPFGSREVCPRHHISAARNSGGKPLRSTQLPSRELRSEKAENCPARQVAAVNL